MRWTRKRPPVGLAARISFTTALVAAAVLSPTGRDGRPFRRMCPTNAAPQLPDDPRTEPPSSPAADAKRDRVSEHSRAPARIAEEEAALGLRNARHRRPQARTDRKIRMRPARLAAHRGRKHQLARPRDQRQPVRARGFRRALPRRLPRGQVGALSETPAEDSIVVVAAAAGALRPAAPVDVAEGGMDVGRQIEARGNPLRASAAARVRLR
jgi:hypothetical protein